MICSKGFFIFIFVLGLNVHAQDAESILNTKPSLKPQLATKPVKQKGENLLDFEAEVIEGEKKRPELFLDIKAGDGNVGSGLYLRQIGRAHV